MTRIIMAGEEHIPAVLEIERQAISPPWTEGMLLAEVGRSDGFFALAVEDDGSVSGFCILRLAAGEGELYQIAVRRERRRQGVGGMLLEAAKEYCRRAGAGSIFLEVRAGNLGAIRFYEKHGFVREGRRKNYYSGPVEDAVVMSARLDGGGEVGQGADFCG